MKFRVLVGKHREGGRTYTQGEIVDSKSDLNKMNAGPNSRKFEQIQEEPVSRKVRYQEEHEEEEHEEENVHEEHEETVVEESHTTPLKKKKKLVSHSKPHVKPNLHSQVEAHHTTHHEDSPKPQE